MSASVLSQRPDSSTEMVKKSFWRLLRWSIIQVHNLFDWIVTLIFSFFYYGQEKKVPPVNDQLLLDSAVVLAEKIRNKVVSSESVVTTCINRCKQVNELLNAIVDERYNEAIEEAKEVDRLLELNPDINILQVTKPFLGVPFTTKESHQAVGLLHSMGTVARKGYRSTEDATAVASVKNSGAILIAKANIPEMNLWVESRNIVYGQTNNPYNTTRAVGGSSGGDAAIIAACGVPFALGSDLGGSIRMPAFLNGVFGLKPSENTTPMKGIGLRSMDFMDTMAEAGPLCKRAEDLIPLLKIIVSDTNLCSKLDTHVNIDKIQIFYQEHSGDLRSSMINAEMRSALLKVVEHLHNITGSAHKIKLPGSEYSYRLWRYWMSQEITNFKSDIMNRSSSTNARAEIRKLLTGKSQITLPAVMKLIDEDFFPKDEKQWAEDVTNAMKEYLLEKIGDNGVLIYPSAPFPASYHYSYFLRPFNFSYWTLANVLRLPSCQIPLGLDKEGLPLGVQVVAAPHQEFLCVAVAKELERKFGGWKPPSV